MVAVVLAVSTFGCEPYRAGANPVGHPTCPLVLSLITTRASWNVNRTSEPVLFAKELGPVNSRVWGASPLRSAISGDSVASLAFRSVKPAGWVQIPRP